MEEEKQKEKEEKEEEEVLFLLFYHYVKIENVSNICEWQINLCQTLLLNGRIRISNEGINGTLSNNNKLFLFLSLC